MSDYIIDLTLEQNPIEMEAPVNEVVEMEMITGPVTINNSGSFRIEKDITYEDFADGSIAIGNIPANKRVVKVSIFVTGAFDAGTMTIGEAAAHGRLMVAGDNNLLAENIYHTEPDYKYAAETEIKAWFETGSPTSGNATIIIYYS